MNNQNPEGLVFANEKLSVHSIFPTIQGEGPYSGHPALFIRLAGCNLQCPLCDTDYTSKRLTYTTSELVDDINQIFQEVPGRLIVITGGEPFRQPIEELVQTLLMLNYLVQIETNGTVYRNLAWSDPDLTIVCSPKTGKVHSKLLPHITAFKYIATCEELSADDGLPLGSLNHPCYPVLFRDFRDNQKVYLQPADEKDEIKNKANEKAVVQSCLKFGYILCLQVHKIVDVE